MVLYREDIGFQGNTDLSVVIEHASLHCSF